MAALNSSSHVFLPDAPYSGEQHHGAAYSEQRPDTGRVTSGSHLLSSHTPKSSPSSSVIFVWCMCLDKRSKMKTYLVIPFFPKCLFVLVHSLA